MAEELAKTTAGPSLEVHGDSQASITRSGERVEKLLSVVETGYHYATTEDIKPILELSHGDFIDFLSRIDEKDAISAASLVVDYMDKLVHETPALLKPLFIELSKMRKNILFSAHMAFLFTTKNTSIFKDNPGAEDARRKYISSLKTQSYAGISEKTLLKKIVWAGE